MATEDEKLAILRKICNNYKHLALTIIVRYDDFADELQKISEDFDDPETHEIVKEISNLLKELGSELQKRVDKEFNQ